MQRYRMRVRFRIIFPLMIVCWILYTVRNMAPTIQKHTASHKPVAFQKSKPNNMDIQTPQKNNATGHLNVAFSAKPMDSGAKGNEDNQNLGIKRNEHNKTMETKQSKLLLAEKSQRGDAVHIERSSSSSNSKPSVAFKPHSCPFIRQYNVTICIHDPALDKVISMTLSTGVMFEPHIVEVVLTWLARFPEAYVLDIGANIGAVTIPAAARGHRVIAFEPYAPNADLLEYSVRKNGLGKYVSVYRQGISDGHYTLRFDVTTRNLGRTQLIDASRCNMTDGYCPPSLEAHTITLDDLPALRPDVRSMVVKLDAEGLERKVIKGANLFWTKVQVYAILMEWEWFGIYFNKKPEDIASTEQMIDSLNSHGFMPYTLDGKTRLEKKNWKRGWGKDVLWINEKLQAKTKLP